MKRFISLAAGLALSAGVAQSAALTVTTHLEAGATSSAFWDINNAGTVVGYSLLPDVARAFTWTPAGGFAALSGPVGAVSSIATGISDGGVIVGSWTSLVGGPSTGFIYDGATYTSFGIAGADDTFLRAVSPDGRYITGYYSTATITGQGFVYDTTTTAITFVGAGGNDFTIAQGVSNAGLVMGSDLLRDDVTGAITSRPGFTFDVTTGIRTEVMLPGAVRTALRAIDEAGVISGWTIDGAGISGFTGYPGVLDVIFAPGAVDTFIEGNNDAGWLVGTANLADGTSRAVLARPVPAPATLALAVLGLAAMGRWSTHRRRRVA